MRAFIIKKIYYFANFYFYNLLDDDLHNKDKLRNKDNLNIKKER